jgi:hypothetical protein
VITCILTPYNVAFYSDDYSAGFLAFDQLVNSAFFIDLVLTFFTAYNDEDEELVVDHKVSSS